MSGLAPPKVAKFSIKWKAEVDFGERVLALKFGLEVFLFWITPCELAPFREESGDDEIKITITLFLCMYKVE